MQVLAKKRRIKPAQRTKSRVFACIPLIMLGLREKFSTLNRTFCGGSGTLFDTGFCLSWRLMDDE